eukprot:2683453-Prymnesium_polylepis.1
MQPCGRMGSKALKRCRTTVLGSTPPIKHTSPRGAAATAPPRQPAAAWMEMRASGVGGGGVFGVGVVGVRRRSRPASEAGGGTGGAVVRDCRIEARAEATAAA